MELLKKVKDIWSQKREELVQRRAYKATAIAELQAELTALDTQIAEHDQEIIEVDNLELKK